MATEKGFVAPPVSTLRKIMKPVISTDIMGNRNVEVRAVGARAEPAPHFTSLMNPEFCDAVKAAEIEEEKIRMLQEKKAARLKQFQEDVRRRVRHINKTKRKQQLENDCLSMEKHLDQVRSSLRASDCLTERKDHSVTHHAPAASVIPPPAKPLDFEKLMDDWDREQEGRKKAFEQHNKQVHAFTNEARKKLSHKKVESDIYETDPSPDDGGWFSHTSKGKPSTLEGRESYLKDYNNDDDDEEDENNGAVNDDRYFIREEPEYRGSRLSQQLTDRLGERPVGGHTKYFPRTSHSCLTTKSQETEKQENYSDEENERDASEKDGEIDDAKLQRVKFNLRTVEVRRPESGKRKGARKKGSVRSGGSASAPDLRAGAIEYEERRRLEQQKLNYRRLYSHLERQAVRDNQRRKQQRAQIQKIKKEKEALRRQEEERTKRLVEPRDPITGETSVECDLRQQMERSHLEEKLQEKEDQRQKQREMIRYLDALRNNLREKLRKQRVELPALCCCGDTLFDTHPETCANNCFYYRNHRAYARALQSLLTSAEIM